MFNTKRLPRHEAFILIAVAEKKAAAIGSGFCIPELESRNSTPCTRKDGMGSASRNTRTRMGGQGRWRLLSAQKSPIGARSK